MLQALKLAAGNVAFRAAVKLGYSPELFAAIGGRTLAVATSGKQVSEQTAMRVAAYKRGVQLISDYVGKTPFHVKAGNAKDKSHAAWPLVRKWSRYHAVSAMAFRNALTVSALMRGNGYGFISRRNGFPVELRVLDPGKVQPVLINGQLRYRFDGHERTVSASDIIHIRGFSLDGFCGIDPLRGYARDVLGLAIAEQDYAARYYENGGHPTVYARSETSVSEDRFNQLTSENGPLRGAIDDPHRIPFLDTLKLDSLGLTAEQTQLIGSREFSLKDIANALGMSVHKLNGDGKSSYKSLEEENRAFRDDTLDPYLCQFENEYEKLLTEAEQESGSHEVEAVRESLTRTNMADRAKYLKDAIGGPWMTPAEGREVDSLPPIDGADELLKPLNMTPKNDGDGTSEDDDDTDAAGRSRSPSRADQLNALSDVFRRMVKRVAVQATKAAAKSDTFPDWLEQIEPRNAETVRSAVGPVLALCGGSAEAAEQIAAEFCRSVRDELSDLYSIRTPGEFPGAVAAAVDNWSADALATFALNQLAA